MLHTFILLHRSYAFIKSLAMRSLDPWLHNRVLTGSKGTPPPPPFIHFLQPSRNQPHATGAQGQSRSEALTLFNTFHPLLTRALIFLSLLVDHSAAFRFATSFRKKTTRVCLVGDQNRTGWAFGKFPPPAPRLPYPTGHFAPARANPSRNCPSRCIICLSMRSRF